MYLSLAGLPIDEYFAMNTKNETPVANTNPGLNTVAPPAQILVTPIGVDEQPKPSHPYSQNPLLPSTCHSPLPDPAPYRYAGGCSSSPSSSRSGEELAAEHMTHAELLRFKKKLRNAKRPKIKDYEDDEPLSTTLRIYSSEVMELLLETPFPDKAEWKVILAQSSEYALEEFEIEPHDIDARQMKIVGILLLFPS